MGDDYHIDMSGRLYEKGNSGIACVGTKTKDHVGCAIKGRTKRLIEKNLCIGKIHEDYARIYAICIYFIIKDRINNIDTLIICNDEDFNYVKEYLYILFDNE